MNKFNKEEIYKQKYAPYEHKYLSFNGIEIFH